MDFLITVLAFVSLGLLTWERCSTARKLRVQLASRPQPIYYEVPARPIQPTDDRKVLVNRLYNGSNGRIVPSPLVPSSIIKVDGGYENGNILVTFPVGVGFRQDIANALNQETEGRYIMQRPQSSGCGGSDNADAIIRAALRTGSHDVPPDLDDMRNLLEELVHVFLAVPVWSR